jgi:hypothetical protein
MQRAETNIVGSYAAIQSGSPPRALAPQHSAFFCAFFAAIPLSVFSMRSFAAIPQLASAAKPASYLSHR